MAMGGDAAQLADTIAAHRVLLAAHGPYTAAGVAETLGHPVHCVSRDFSSFDGEPLCRVVLGLRVGVLCQSAVCRVRDKLCQSFL